MRSKRLRQFIPWIPRVLSFLFIAFISLFALDVFEEKNWPLALFMHLIPSYVLTAFTIIAWKKESLGGLIFIISGLGLAIISRGEIVILYLPAMTLGLLYLSSGYLTKKANER